MIANVRAVFFANDFGDSFSALIVDFWIVELAVAAHAHITPAFWTLFAPADRQKKRQLLPTRKTMKFDLTAR